MSGLSIYLVFITAGLIAAPRRVSWLIVLVAIAVSVYWVNRDIDARPPILITEASESGVPGLKQGDQVPPVSPERCG